MSLRTPLGRVLGLGASGGSHHWWLHRLSSVALVPLGAWVVASLLTSEASYELQRAALARPFNAALMLAFLVVALHHSWLGVRVVIEDYVHTPGRKVAALLAVQFLHVLAGAVAVVALLKIAVGGSP
jgi:succinate dehydrogenase / fumarate reductase, membrane anchor subunit